MQPARNRLNAGLGVLGADEAQRQQLGSFLQVSAAPMGCTRYGGFKVFGCKVLGLQGFGVLGKKPAKIRFSIRVDQRAI